MSDLAICVRNIGKRYQLGAAAERPESLREALVGAVKAPLANLRRLRSGGNSGNPLMWALQDVSFDVRHGEVVGIIGRNGAGKSTLLKVLSRITPPTRGRARVFGRVGSLLEVGTGFHPELTGRENIYLNGSILGMDRPYIDRVFDEIVDFSGVEKFVDTPVKRYSSGMYLRLAFAVAAHLEPEVLIVDEVLAVGDAHFQRKCMDKMQDVSQRGRTVLFVSHNMPAIMRLCPRTILLDQGTVLEDGPSHQVIRTYLQSGLGTTAAREWPDRAKAPGNQLVRLRAARVLQHEQVTDAVDIRRSVALEIEWDVLEGGHALVPNFHLYNEEGACVFVSIDSDREWRGQLRPAGRFTSRALIPGNLLAEGSLLVKVAITTQNPETIHVSERDVVAFQVVDSFEGDSARGDYARPLPGLVRPLLNWETQYAPALR